MSLNDRATQDAFLAELARTGRIAQSAKKAGVSRHMVAAYRRDCEEFEQLVKEALELYGEGLEQEAHRRGVDGVEEPVYQMGSKVGTVTKFSDRLLELLLKKNVPAYRESVKVDGNIAGGVLLVASGELDPAKWKEKHERAVQDPPQ